MALAPDQKFSTFAVGGDLQLNDIIVGLRGGINTQFTWSGSDVNSIQGTINQVFANGTYGTPEMGNIILTLPQDIATTSSPTFNQVNLNSVGFTDNPAKFYDIYGNLAYVFSALPDAVNYLSFGNAPTNNAPGIIAQGTDPNVNFGLQTTGTGTFFLETLATSNQLNLLTGSALGNTFILSFPNSAGPYTATFPAASGTVAYTSGLLTTFNTDSGTATPAANAITITGSSTGLTTTGSGSTVGLTGVLNLANGGTQANLTASNGGIFYSTASAGAILAGTATARQILQSGASNTPAWSTATYPATTTINQLLYSSAANTITGLATVTTAVLTTSAGVPTWANQLSLALGGTNANLTASNGGIVYSTASALAILSGTATANLPLLSQSSTAPVWGSFALSLGGALTTAGALTLSGAFASTFTFTNTTSVTFPTSGTLATTAGTVASITGTANQIIASASTGAVTLSAPQNLNTTAAFQVNTLQLNNGNGILDAAGNILLSTSGGQTQNYIQIANGGVGFAPTLKAVGGDTNIAFGLYAKGTNSVQTYTTGNIGLTLNTGTANQHITYFTFANTSASDTVTFPDATFTVAGTALSLGGTNANLTASNGGIVYSTASAMAILAGTATAGQLLTSGASTTPAWTTSTYPATNAINTLLYASSANVMAALATANSSVLVTSSGGVPSLSTTLPSGIAATNMALTTPKVITQINDTNGNKLIGITATASATNAINIANAATGSSPVISVVGSSDTNQVLTMQGLGTGGVAIQGTAASSPGNASAGYVGELLAGTNATAVAMTSNTATQINTLSLTAGDWDVWGVFYTAVTGTTVSSYIAVQLNTSTATISNPTTAQLSAINGNYGTVTTGVVTNLNTGVARWNVGTTTTVYLNAIATYSASTLTGNGNIYARRVR